MNVGEDRIYWFWKHGKSHCAGFIKNNHHQLWATAPSLSIGINEYGIHTHHDNAAIIPRVDILILAVKPAQMPVVFAQIKHAIPAHCLIISVAAGISLSWFARQINKPLAIVRAMPNMAAAVGKAATPMIANEFVSAEQAAWTETIFSSIGLSTWILNEQQIDSFTALSGSGPAYVFLFMEAMIKAATALGLEEDIAKIFTLQTFEGALSLASENQMHLAALRQQVTSPAGTTAAAIEVFSKQGLDKLVLSAMNAAFERARELQTINHT
ncbi:pyrroline-5-carboxylate reductase [Legionella oakridgensis ATCC 33761 = DSM 21215]|uniref:Pyrroline-5-carboxylate reductase n=2 Tax=Legionella oakridgensis TaxID=29423 RepID=W0BDE3_9GAMM|nr:pyrroline-5-carboxylate reductase [Legionella oakridgensis ATCC 33761 = DSM 21215]